MSASPARPGGPDASPPAGGAATACLFKNAAGAGLLSPRSVFPGRSCSPARPSQPALLNRACRPWPTPCRTARAGHSRSNMTGSASRPARRDRVRAVHVRFAPKATELLHRDNMTRCATRGKSACFWLGPISGSHQGHSQNGCTFRGRIHDCTRIVSRKVRFLFPCTANLLCCTTAVLD